MAANAGIGNLDWNLVRTFVVVAEQGSLAAAARALGLAHPTVARHVQSLESALGTTLFERCAGGLRLNEAGAQLAASARGMQDGAREFELASRSVGCRQSGRVRITASEFIADVFPELLSPLRRVGDQGLINVELLIANHVLNVLEGEADIAIRHIEPRQQELVCRRLAGLPAGLYASRGYVAERGMPVAGNLGEHWFIDEVRSSRVQRHARRLGYSLRTDQFVFRSDSFVGRLNGAEAGWGIAVVPVHVARRRSALVRVLDDVSFREIEMWLVARRDVRTTPYLHHAFTVAGDTLNAFAGALAERTSGGDDTAGARADGRRSPRRHRRGV